MVKTILYYLAIAALFTHELDAVLNYEWRLLFHAFELNEALASTIFIGLHLPLFFIFFYVGHHPNPKVQIIFRVLACIVVVAHSLAHFTLSNHAKYYFEGLFPNLYIYGAAAFSLGFLWLAWSEKSKNA